MPRLPIALRFTAPAAVLVLAMITVSPAQPLPWVQGSGGGESAGSQHRARLTLGEILVGSAASDSTLARTGFWAGYLYSPPVPVSLQQFRATWIRGGVTLTWAVAGDASGHAGFHVYREVNRVKVRITSALLPAALTYEYRDQDPPPGRVSYWLAEIDRAGGTSWHGPVSLDIDTTGRPIFSLLQNVPNPVRSSTRIGFQLVEPGPVRLRVFDLSGRPVATLLNEILPAGNFETLWDGTNSLGRKAAAGMYVYRLETAAGTRSRKLVLAH